MGLLFDIPEQASPSGSQPRVKVSAPNPYAPSSSSDDDLEADLEEVATVRRSLLRSKPKNSSDRAKKGWLAHQSIFPPSSSSSDEYESDKETEEETGDEEGSSPTTNRRQHVNTSLNGYALSPSELHQASAIPPIGDMEEPLLGPDNLQGDMSRRTPVKLHVYHGRFGHWEREGFRKYKGTCNGRTMLKTDSAFLVLWLTSLLAVLFGLFFVWGSTDVSLFWTSCLTHRLRPTLPLDRRHQWYRFSRSCSCYSCLRLWCRPFSCFSSAEQSGLFFSPRQSRSHSRSSSAGGGRSGQASRRAGWTVSSRTIGGGARRG